MGSLYSAVHYWLVDHPRSVFPVALVTNASVHTLMYAYYLFVRPGEEAVVEEIGDRLSDRAVRVWVCDVRFFAVSSFHRIRVLRDLELVLQHRFQRFAFGPLR
ncbi:GNS1/SUR4 membrane protein family [Actinidia rufa]|uniref:GNS1/SUR4 membrane protein family n=1 Tax=Actinidia rufa TaxID=165716 RepID=A0A7J0ETM7_9ERIC|nr:GNS1/SUR4 membrane protein family [Actinidia rufa]